jgi:hypothetical protein
MGAFRAIDTFPPYLIVECHTDAPPVNMDASGLRDFMKCQAAGQGKSIKFAPLVTPVLCRDIGPNGK